MIKLKNILTKILEVICVIMFAFITIVGTYQIVTRYVFNAPSTVSEELLTYSFTWLAHCQPAGGGRPVGFFAAGGGCRRL